jgi:MoaA/NifB/PqqE/SkfB family radical SAM enzyme
VVSSSQFALKYWYASIARPEVMPFLPSIIHLETTTKCNLACTICPRTNSLNKPGSKEDERWNKNLSLEQFQEILDQLGSLRYVRLHGFGEPLMNPDLSHMISLLSSRGIDAEFTTNASLLSQKKSEALIRSNLSYLTVSIDGATKEVYENIRTNARFKNVIGNILELRRLKEKLNKKRPHLRINMVVTSENIHEFLDTIKLAKVLGAAEFRASPIVPPREDLGWMLPDPELWAQTSKEAKILARSLRIHLVCSGSPNRAINTQAESKSKTISRCKQPWVAPYIRVDGFVTPCCNISGSDVLGNKNVFLQDFRMIWNSDEFQRFRRNLKFGPLPKDCVNCPNLK